MFLFQTKFADSIAVKKEPSAKELLAGVKAKVEAIESYIGKAMLIAPGGNLAKSEKEFTLFELNEGTSNFRQNIKDVVNALILSKNEGLGIRFAEDKMNTLWNLIGSYDFNWKNVVSQGNKTPEDAITWEKLDLDGCLFSLVKAKKELGFGEEKQNKVATGQKKGAGKIDLKQKVQPTPHAASPASGVSENTLKNLMDKNTEFKKLIEAIAKDYAAEAKEISIPQALNMVHKNWSDYRNQSLESLNEASLIQLANKVGTEYSFRQRHRSQGIWGDVVRLHP